MMNKDNQQKKVFDVMRPGKALASPTSRPVITGHKPQVKDDQFVDGDPHMAGNPFDEKALMDHPKESKFSEVDASADKAGQAEKEPDEQLNWTEKGGAPEAETGVSVSASATSQKSPEPPAEETPKLPANFAEEPDKDKPAEDASSVAPSDSPKGYSEDIALVPDEPQAPAPVTTKNEQSDLTPEDITEEPEPESKAESEPEPAPTSGNVPSVISPSGSSQAMTHDDIMAATDAPVLDRAIVSHHKVKSRWWEWVLIFLLILVLALLALNFLIDAEIIKLNAAVPHTNLIN